MSPRRHSHLQCGQTWFCHWLLVEDRTALQAKCLTLLSLPSLCPFYLSVPSVPSNPPGCLASPIHPTSLVSLIPLVFLILPISLSWDFQRVSWA